MCLARSGGNNSSRSVDRKPGRTGGGLGFVASVLKERRILGHYWGKPALLSEMLGEPLGLSADSDGRVAEKHRSSCGFGVMQPGQGAEGRAVWRTGDAYNRRQNALL